MPTHPFIRQIALALALLPVAAPCAAADIKGSQDHPMISRYRGAEIVAYKATAFDNYPLLVRKSLQVGGIAKNQASTQAIEGEITRISYRAPAGRSTLEVFRNYEAALRNAGFEPLFSCSESACGGHGFARSMAENHGLSSYGVFGEMLAQDQHYLAARHQRAEGDVYAMVYVAVGPAPKGGKRDTAYVALNVIETRPMDSGKVTVDMAAMEKGIAADGRIALYNIYFDTDKATLKPDSRPALQEIAKLMKAQPKLKLLVVGHTDNIGDLKYNANLSEQRARAVVQALASEHAVEASRLSAAGVGMYAPVASNRSEEGRRKNRRVELVER